ncbi:MAG: M15 family metallopeptidase [Acidimicrobiales bacterium]
MAMWRRAVAAAVALLVAACSSGSADELTRASTPTTETTTPTTSTTTGPAPPPTTPGLTRPAWLGTRPLPVRSDGFGEVLPTPPELVDRRIPTVDVFPPPADGIFAFTTNAVPNDVAARSTWHADCPVTLEQLRYVTVSFWGFDDRPHTGELLVNAEVADDVAGVFRGLYDARFPIEEMRIIRAEELDAPPTGDGNATTAFVCRPAVGGSSWSQHAFGLAIDINPFHNPYRRGDLVLPELASAYVDRDHDRPGMIQPQGPVTVAFDAIGWGWGGRWSSLLDYMHFSRSGR